MENSNNDSPSLGWKVKKEKNTYDCAIPQLSEDEEEFLRLLANEFSEYSKNYDASTPSLAKKAVDTLFSQLLSREGIEVDDEQQKYLSNAAISHLAGFAPLDAMLNDENIEEIAVIGIKKPIYVYLRKKGWQKTNASFTTHEHLIHIINKMARSLGRRITSNSPRINALLPNNSRMHASIPPLSKGELTIRLHSSTPWSIADILQTKSTTPQALSFLWLAFQSDSSILIAGNTSSGKTTLLNSLSSFIPLNERILVIEETPEIRLPHPHLVQLTANEDLQINMTNLVRDSLRMRPDRVIVGEIRTPPEVEAFAETLLSGHARGSYATFHAQSANEAIRRLQNLGISQDDLSSLNFIVMQRRIARYDANKKKQKEIRKMLGIYMLSNLKLLPIFEFNPNNSQLLPTPHLKSALSLLSQKLGIQEKQIKKLFSSRTSFLSRLTPRHPDEITNKMQKFAYG
ncbi:MAG: ATPase, T2SS/T4P/T4SS family [Candidatus Micrarchaeota archaeon]